MTSLRAYFARSLIAALVSAVAIVAMVLAVFYVGLIQGVFYPANEGEIRARAASSRQQAAGHYTGDIDSALYDYIVLDAQGARVATSLSASEADAKLAQYTDRHAVYSAASYLNLQDGSCILFMWHYYVNWANPHLEQFLPPVELTLVVCTLLLLILLFGCYVGMVDRKFSAQLALMTQASDQIAAQNLGSPICANASISEFGHVLESMEDMRQALQTSLLEQWQADESRKQNIAALTHDLKTPLTIIGGNAELLLEDEPEEEQARLIEAIRAAGVRTGQYVSALQQASSLSEGEEPLALTDVKSLLGDVLPTLGPLADAKAVTLMVDEAAANRPIQIYPLLLGRALVNIGENAIRYSAQGGEVSLRVTQTGEETTFTFTDEGGGFTPEGLKKATEMFWQADKSRQRSGSFGMGLATAQRAAVQHRGELHLSNTDKGSCVQLTITKLVGPV